MTETAWCSQCEKDTTQILYMLDEEFLTNLCLECQECGCRVPIGIGEPTSPSVGLHVVGVVQPMRQCAYLGDIYDDKRSSMLALSLLDYFEGQRVEVTVRVLPREDECLKE